MRGEEEEKFELRLWKSRQQIHNSLSEMVGSVVHTLCDLAGNCVLSDLNFV